MQELWPVPNPDVDIAERLRGDARPAPEGRPWLTLSMISSLDGAISLAGVSGGLGSPGDQRRFVALRRQAQCVLVGATTARVEDYQPTSVPIAIVTGSLSLDPTARLFGDPERRPILYTTRQAAEQSGDRFAGIAEVIALGDSIEPHAVVGDLSGRGLDHVALEGGPTLNGHYLAADLVDELLLSVSPVVAGGPSSRLAGTADLPDPRRFTLDRVLTEDGLVFLRYLRKRLERPKA